ncbi:hypothetical protein F4782DRAFT_486943 [Xylaria castorea]|nr:hypothetical protein F4782DRAFT_486943 [Xylaria castorea]
MDHLFSLMRNTTIDYNGTQYNRGMQIFTRANTGLWPYAASSTRPYRGLLAQKYPCWDAHGPAREVFFTEIAGKIKNCLEHCLPESDSFIGYSLFMVGKSPEKTKPYVMMVSDDKQRRKAAFKLIKSQKFMAKHLGFELGHCAVAAEFEDLQQLGEGHNDMRDPVSDSGSTAIDSQFLSSLIPCAIQPILWTQPTEIGFHTPTGQHRGSGTCGGLFTYKYRLYCFVVAHALRQTTMPEPIPSTSGHPSDCSSDSDDCEMTGMEDWDDSEEGSSDAMTTVASASSQSPFEHSDNEDDLVDSHDSSSLFEADLSRTTPSQIVVNSRFMEDTELNRDTVAETCEPIGSIVGIERDLDLVIMRIVMDSVVPVQSCEELLKLAEDYEYDMTDNLVVIKTNHDAEIYGRRSKTPVYMRLPGTRTFQLLYNIRFKVPIRAGDCGSWVFNEASGQLVGFVVAGSPRTGWCLVSPARVALEKMIALLEALPQPGAIMALRAPTQLPLIASVFPAASTSRGNTPGFLPVETNGQLSYGIQGTTDSRTPIQISIQAVLDKGFFLSEGEWTCFRRNNFTCVCSYNLTPSDYNLPTIYTPNGESTAYQVVGFAISISAVSGNEARSIDLVLHTPKEDKGPTSSPDKIRLNPKPLQSPQIPPERVAEPSMPEDRNRTYGEEDSQSRQGPYATEHTFERVQFMRATADNGRRQVNQGYCHLVVELYADIGTQKPGQQFMKIASKKSKKLVVRGRSPSH